MYTLRCKRSGCHGICVRQINSETGSGNFRLSGSAQGSLSDFRIVSEREKERRRRRRTRRGRRRSKGKGRGNEKKQEKDEEMDFGCLCYLVVKKQREYPSYLGPRGRAFCLVLTFFWAALMDFIIEGPRGPGANYIYIY